MVSLQRLRLIKTKVHNATGKKGYYFAKKKEKLHSCTELKAKGRTNGQCGKMT